MEAEGTADPSALLAEKKTQFESLSVEMFGLVIRTSEDHNFWIGDEELCLGIAEVDRISGRLKTFIEARLRKDLLDLDSESLRGRIAAEIVAETKEEIDDYLKHP